MHLNLCLVSIHVLNFINNSTDFFGSLCFYYDFLLHSALCNKLNFHHGRWLLGVVNTVILMLLVFLCLVYFIIYNNKCFVGSCNELHPLFHFLFNDSFIKKGMNFVFNAVSVRLYHVKIFSIIISQLNTQGILKLKKNIFCILLSFTYFHRRTQSKLRYN